MLDFILSPLSFLMAFVLYKSSDIIKLKRWAKVSRYLAFATLAITICVWIFSFNEKGNAGAIGYHQQLVTSVTYHVEKLLKNGDYKNAETILNRFNSGYWKYSNDNEGLKNFIQGMNIPLFSREKEELEQMIKKIDEKSGSEPAASVDR
jgi:hypothetical protein